jgi:hypothetical protein
MLSATRRSRAPEQPAAPSVPVLGWVVVVWQRSIADGGWRPTGLTNSDLSGREAAEHEAAAWRAQAVQKQTGKRYTVRPVMDTED